jgi:hypothetical protein
MASYHGSSVYAGCEYVTLDLDDATKFLKDYTWDMNGLFDNQYQSNERGGLCTVQCTGGMGSLDTKFHGLHIFWKSKSINARNANNKPPLLASSYGFLNEPSNANASDICVHNINGVGEFITAARPSLITLTIEDDRKAELITPAGYPAPKIILNLKFTYYDPITSTYDEKHRLNYKTL